MYGYSFSDIAIGSFLVVYGLMVLIPGLGIPGVLAGILSLAGGVLIFMKK